MLKHHASDQYRFKLQEHFSWNTIPIDRFDGLQYSETFADFQLLGFVTRRSLKGNAEYTVYLDSSWVHWPTLVK